MKDNVFTALNLMLVGMITVFLILLLVVASGYFLTLIVNSLNGDKKDNTDITSKSLNISPKQIAAIQTTVEIISGGKGRITEIERLD
jgi:oxaloacetate decarboxylase (Na+ extruding) subunit gamma